MTGNRGGPMKVARTRSGRSHARGERHAFDAPQRLDELRQRPSKRTGKCDPKPRAPSIGGVTVLDVLGGLFSVSATTRRRDPGGTERGERPPTAPPTDSGSAPGACAA